MLRSKELPSERMSGMFFKRRFSLSRFRGQEKGIGSPKKEGNLVKYTRSNGQLFFPRVGSKISTQALKVDLPSQRKERDWFPGLEENPQRGQAQSIEG